MAALLVVFGTFRIDPFDVPEHLAVGRWIVEHGRPMTTNEISWTFPEYPNHQQYPLYQLAIWGLYSTLGPTSLSVFCAAGWTAAVGAWAGWAGGVRQAAWHVPLWLLAVIGVQRHLVARPEVATLLGLALLLVAFESWRSRPRWGPIVAMWATVWVMVNSHQMYVFGLILLVGFVVHVALTRALAGRGWIDEADAALPLAPLGIAVVGGLVVTALSPLGWRAWLAPWALVATVLNLGGQGERVESAELGPIWDDPVGGPLTLLLVGVIGLAGARARGRWQVLELGVLALGLGLVAIAMRGIPFAAVAVAAVASRWWQRSPPWSMPLLGTVGVGLAGWSALVLLVAMLKPQPVVYLARRPGLGLAEGEWAERATSFLREDPPPGRMMNVGWVAANYLNLGVYPVREVFVDGRWEAYPMDFLMETVRGERDQDVLDGLIERWDPGFVVVELRVPSQQDRLATLVARGWGLVYVDSVLAVAVRRDTPEGRAYADAHPVDLDALGVVDALPEHPVFHAQQKVRVAGLLRRLGADARAEALRTEAASVDHPAVVADLVRYR